MTRHNRTRDLVTDMRQREGYLITRGFEMLADDDLSDDELSADVTLHEESEAQSEAQSGADVCSADRPGLSCSPMRHHPDCPYAQEFDYD